MHISINYKISTKSTTSIIKRLKTSVAKGTIHVIELFLTAFLKSTIFAQFSFSFESYVFVGPSLH